MWFDTPVQKKQVAVDGGGEEEVEERPTQYGVYRSILPKVGGDKRASPNEGAEALADLRALQLASSAGAVGEEERPRCWTLLMFGGGHFAGMVVDLKPRLVGQGKGKEKAREVEVIERKTFHRYTSALSFSRLEVSLPLLTLSFSHSSSQARRIAIRQR